MAGNRLMMSRYKHGWIHVRKEDLADSSVLSLNYTGGSQTIINIVQHDLGPYCPPTSLSSTIIPNIIMNIAEKHIS